ncbi:MAG: OmpA family protein [Prevotella sp.]|nr:OmpA family protein [Prevotella sp.]
MKKLFLVMAAAMLTASASAQRTAVTANKAQDNWYIGINAGAATPMQKFGDYGFMKGIAPKAGLRIGKNLTTVFGIALDADFYLGSKTDSKSLMGSKTFLNSLNLDLLATFNLMNAFAGYKGEPRTFEMIALAGGGWDHQFGVSKANGLNTKFALDFALNLGENKDWQVYLEPAVIFGMKSWGLQNAMGIIEPVKAKFDSRNGLFQLSAGVNYKFGNSNGSHNFKIEELRDQAEIDGLNAKINELRADNNAKDGKIAADAREIADLKAKLAACEARPVQVVEEKKENILQPMVIFRQGKSVIDAAQYASIEMVAKYMRNHKDAKVIVRGFASPEGNAELNQKLSEARAAAVKTALIKRYKIAADRISTEGLGATDKISEENDFNRVAMFIDTTK